MPQLSRPPALLACIECRRKHLKCDGKMPDCTRCTTRDLTCSYTPSRRGFNQRARPKSVHSLASSRQSITGSATDVAMSMSPASTDLSDTSPSLQDNTQARAAFYAQFHPAHPILLPERFYSIVDYPDYLNLLVSYIGERYCVHERPNPKEMSQAVAYAMHPSQDDGTVHRVQALVLYAIVLHSDRCTDDTFQCVMRANQMCSALRMQRVDVGDEFSGLEPLKLEGLRRTFWELYTLGVYLAALHQKPALVLPGSILSETPLLPCSEAEYSTGQISGSSGHTLSSFGTRLFSTQSSSIEPSSYSYRIEAARLIDRVLKLQSSPSSASVQSVDSALASWAYYAPDIYKSRSATDKQLNPLCFQANVFAHCASIFLHFPRSDLPMTVPSAQEVSCASSCKPSSDPTSAHHTVKATAASREIAHLASLPWSSSFGHSPLFICALVLGAVVQLAEATACDHVSEQESLQQCQDRLLLMLGVLKRYGQQWPVAEHAHKQLKGAASCVFFTGKAFTTGASTIQAKSNVSAPDSGTEIADTDSTTISWFDLFSNSDLQNDLLSIGSDFAYNL